MLILTILNAICLTIGYVVLIYVILCSLTYLWLGKSFKEETLRISGEVPFSSCFEFFLRGPIEVLIEIYAIVKEKKNKSEDESKSHLSKN